MKLIDIVNNLKEQFGFNQDIGLRRNADATLNTSPGQQVTLVLLDHDFNNGDSVYIKGLDPMANSKNFNADKLYEVTAVSANIFTIEIGYNVDTIEPVVEVVSNMRVVGAGSATRAFTSYNEQNTNEFVIFVNSLPDSPGNRSEYSRSDALGNFQQGNAQNHYIVAGYQVQLYIPTHETQAAFLETELARNEYLALVLKAANGVYITDPLSRSGKTDGASYYENMAINTENASFAIYTYTFRVMRQITIENNYQVPSIPFNGLDFNIAPENDEIQEIDLNT